MVFDEGGPLACPRCGSALSRRSDAAVTCASCRQSYPLIGAIPCLVDDPPLWRALWLSRINEYLTLIEKRVFFARQALDLPDRLPRTATRLARLIAGLEDQRSKLIALLRPVIAGELAIPSRPEDRPTVAV